MLSQVIGLNQIHSSVLKLETRNSKLEIGNCFVRLRRIELRVYNLNIPQNLNIPILYNSVIIVVLF